VGILALTEQQVRQVRLEMLAQLASKELLEMSVQQVTRVLQENKDRPDLLEPQA